MDLITCLDEPVFQLPQNPRQEHLDLYLKKVYSDYLQAVYRLSERHIRVSIDEHIPRLEAAMRELVESVAYSLKGRLFKSYEFFNSAMAVFKPFLLFDENGGMAKEFLRARPYYRARTDNGTTFTKKDLFHLPFSKRAYANANRFSIPGLPCLYLCNSVYVCWEELGRPPFDTMLVSKFRQENLDLQILNLAQTPINLQIQLRAFASSRMDTTSVYHRQSITLLMTWPLVMACSLIGSARDTAFRSEYIVPQLLMQWMMEQKDIAGIKYSSNRVKHYNRQEFSKFFNYVFPPKNITAGDYCSELASNFKMTEPVSASLVKLVDGGEQYLKVKPSTGGDDIHFLELIKGSLLPYQDTAFGELEIFLRKMEFMSL